MVKLELLGKCDLLIKNTAENEKYLNFDTILLGNFERQLKSSMFWVTTKYNENIPACLFLFCPHKKSFFKGIGRMN